MEQTYTLVKRDGSREEVPFMYRDGVPCISHHIFKSEFGQRDTGQVVVYEPLVELFEKVREIIKRPIRINSGYRSPEYQANLYRQDPSGAVAKPGNSPHQTGAAMDLGIPPNFTAQSFAALFRKTSKELGFPEARTGWKMYGGTFIHVDLVFMLYAPYTKEINPNPRDWSPGVMW